MKASTALLSFATLAIVFGSGTLASPILANGEGVSVASNDVLSGTPSMSDIEAAEDNLRLRADSYGWDHHRKHYGWRRELDATTKGTAKSSSQHYPPHHYHHHWWHHHHYSKYPRDDNDDGAPEDNSDFVDDGAASAAATQMKRDEAYGRHWNYHHKGYYPRDDDDDALVSSGKDKREDGYSRHHHYKKHGYGHYRRDDSDEDSISAPFDSEKREEGYSPHHYHKKHGYYRRDDSDLVSSDIEDGPLDERDESADELYRHYKYPRDTDHWGWRWRHLHKFFPREDLPSDLDVEMD
ncbi:hypothetical protein CVT26_002574 [Gymnopilus dilepis]|uniref:Uncharacterized protein n=1 Tax=Gymnopilus dilepis TaxID=231916 RepID=A0A409VF30_9AGAR|nr:hypothetical protein CVT26_002574 [Gymnopilus dilepis]